MISLLIFNRHNDNFRPKKILLDDSVGNPLARWYHKKPYSTTPWGTPWHAGTTAI